MEENQLSPEESLALITSVIDEARVKFEENGSIYIVWGALVTVASFLQFILLKKGMGEWSYFPYFGLALGGIYTAFYFSKKKERSTNQIGRIVGITWIVLAINILILGFGFFPFLLVNLIPVILILMALGLLVSSVALRSRVLFWSGLMLNVAGFICFGLDWAFHPLLLCVASFAGVLVPGVILYVNKRKSAHV